MKRIGVRLKKLPSEIGHPAIGAAKLFDVETGEEIHFVKLELIYARDGAIIAKVKFFVSTVDVIE